MHQRVCKDIAHKGSERLEGDEHFCLDFFITLKVDITGAICTRIASKRRGEPS
jgi:hypothetical protein